MQTGHTRRIFIFQIVLPTCQQRNLVETIGRRICISLIYLLIERKIQQRTHRTPNTEMEQYRTVLVFPNFRTNVLEITENISN